MWRKPSQNAKFEISIMYSNLPRAFSFGDDDEANLFGMYGTPEDKAKMVSKTRRRGEDGGTMYTQDDLGDM